MKRALLVMMILLSTFGNTKAIDLETRIGLGYFGYYGDWDAHVGALTSFKVLDRFYFRPGVLVNWDSGSNRLFRIENAKLGVSIPLYASYLIPVNRVMNIRMNVGPFVGRSSLQFNAGTAVEGGLEFYRFYAGFFWFKDIAGENYSRVNLSVGHRFTL